MSFTMQLPTFQVETKSDSTLYPSRNKANEHYQENVKQKIPCELFKDGILVKLIYNIKSIFKYRTKNHEDYKNRI